MPITTTQHYRTPVCFTEILNTTLCGRGLLAPHRHLDSNLAMDIKLACADFTFPLLPTKRFST